MKSIANQYRDLKEGKLSQFNFMRNLRMMMPQHITNVTSFNDAIRILKSKSILTEAFDPRDAADTAAEELAIAAGDYDAAVGMLQDEMGLSLSAASAIAARVYEPEMISGEEDYDTDYEEPRDDFPMSDYNDGEFWEAKDGDDDAETQAMIDKIEQEMAGEEAVKAQYDITEAKEKVNIENIYPTELSMGIKVEMEHTKDAKKAKKIALDHLAENPFYYTQLALSGVDTKVTPTKEKKAIAKKKDETELVDKVNQMKPVKGVEKAKASANKATKETNKPVKGISLMSLIAKTSRGVKKMEPTSEKMKVVKEDYQSFLAQKKREEEAAETYGGFKRGDKVMIDPDAAKATGLKAGKVYTITNFRVYKAGSILQNVDALLDNGEEINVDYIFKAPKVFTSSTNLGGYDLNKLKEMVREVLAEMESDDEVTADVALGMDETMDGRDNLTDTAGHQLNELSGALSKVKDKIVNSSLFKKLIDTIVSKMSDKDIATFKAKFNIAEAEGGPSLEDIMAKVDTINPDKTAKTPEDLKEALDEDTLEGKIANLVRSVAGINLVALGGVPLGLLINSLLGISTWGFGAFIGPVISLVASLIIHGISSKLLGKTDDDSVI